MENYKFVALPCKIPEPLCSFAGVYLPQFSSVFIQGGFGDSESKNIYCLNLETMDWRLKTSCAESLVGHAAVEIEGRMLIFGGWNEKEYTNCSIFYDPLDDSIKKSMIQPAQTEWEYPAGRRDHTFTYADNNVYLFGGWDSWKWSNTSSSFSQLWKLTETWKWEICEVFGENPSTRRGHSTIFFEELNELVVFGGIYGYSTLLGDLYVLNLKDMLWNKLQTEDGPSKRAWHCAANIGRFMYIFAGLVEIKKTNNELFRFDLVDKVWQEIKITGTPIPRCGALMLSVDGFLLIIGGKNQQEESLNDVHVLDIDNQYAKYRDNANNYGIVNVNQVQDISPPPIPKEYVKSRFFVAKSNFKPTEFV